MKYKWFEHKECEYYPCHKFERINCKFCFCPLYHMFDCGGEPKWIVTGRFTLPIKDCSKCSLPHEEDGYDKIIKKLQDVRRLNESNIL